MCTLAKLRNAATKSNFRKAATSAGPLLIVVGVSPFLWQFWPEYFPLERKVRAVARALSPPSIQFFFFVAVWLGAVAAWWGCHSRSFEWCFAFDKEKPQKEAKDGTSAFIALATFALAQGAALTVVARGEGRTLIVLVIYGVVVVFTICWIGTLLRVPQTETDDENHERDVLAYDDVSVTYGRWALVWTVFVGAIMVFLGWHQLLPNQTHRVAYPHRDIVTERPKLLETEGSGVLNEIVPNALVATSWDSLPKWLQSIGLIRGNRQTRLVWLEQRNEFQDYYKSFTAELIYDSDNFRVGRRIAMLVHWDRSRNNLVYRQLELTPLPDGGFRDKFEVTDPNPNEVLVLLLEVRNNEPKNDVVTEDVDSYRLGITVSK